MQTLPFGFSAIATAINGSLKPTPFFSSSSTRVLKSCSDGLSLSKQGICRASQEIAELFGGRVENENANVVVREARIEDSWEVAETHCTSFFPNHSFPLHFVLRLDRLLAMLAGFSLPPACHRTCFVALLPNSAFLLATQGYVTGILTVDTVADFLPRKGPRNHRRTGIAYISNVAVRERYRRKGIAKRLIQKAEAQARSWGCRAVALHCDIRNPGAIKLYKGEGYKCVKVPEGANWPQPKTSPDIVFAFMMKLLNTPTTT